MSVLCEEYKWVSVPLPGSSLFTRTQNGLYSFCTTDNGNVWITNIYNGTNRLKAIQSVFAGTACLCIQILTI